MSQYLNTALIEQDLCLDGQEACGSLDWLEQSFLDSENFWRALKNTADRRFSIACSSRVFDRYNFFYDIVHRNPGKNATALCWYDRSSDFKRISYDELAALATKKASAWSRRGLLPGQTLCIIRSMGIELAVELLAALKNGYIISLLSAEGEAYLQRRLVALEPDYIVTAKENRSMLPDWTERILQDDQTVESTRREAETYFSYPSMTTVFRCFDPCSPNPELPVDMSSDAAYLLALRDGLLALALEPGQVYAAPGFNLLETQPSLLLSGLLCGAAFLHLDVEQIEADPQLVAMRVIKTFGVCKKIRDVLLERQVEVGPQWQRWFRNPLECQDVEQWYRFVNSLGLENSFAYNLKWQAALGGCPLFSVGRKGTVHMSMLPAPGTPWELSDISAADTESTTDFGVFCTSVPDGKDHKKLATTCTVLKSKQEVFPVGVNIASREGRFFPAAELLEALEVFGVRHSIFCSIAEVSHVDVAKGSHFILLVFTGTESNPKKPVIATKLRKLIDQQLGQEFQPDGLEFFPLYPRFLPGMKIDHEWCRRQYLSGWLWRRSRAEIFQQLTRLRGSALATRIQVRR